MQRDVNNIIKHQYKLKQFFDYPEERDHFIGVARPTVLNALNSLIRFTEKVLEHHHPHHHHKLMSEHGDKIHFLLSARNEREKRHRLRHVNHLDNQNKFSGGSLSGGSFFGSIGSFFSHAARSVGHAFKRAGEGIYDVGRHAVHGIRHAAEATAHGVKTAAEATGHAFETAGKAVYHGVKDVGEKAIHGIEEGAHEVGHFFKGVADATVEAADVALDVIKEYGPDVLEKALPYIEKGLNVGAAALANAVVPGSGVFVSQGLNLAEQAANPLIKQQIEKLKPKQPDYEGSGLIGLAYRQPQFYEGSGLIGLAYKQPQFLRQYPRDNLNVVFK